MMMFFEEIEILALLVIHSLIPAAKGGTGGSNVFSNYPNNKFYANYDSEIYHNRRPTRSDRHHFLNRADKILTDIRDPAFRLNARPGATDKYLDNIHDPAFRLRTAGNTRDKILVDIHDPAFQLQRPGNTRDKYITNIKDYSKPFVGVPGDAKSRPPNACPLRRHYIFYCFPPEYDPKTGKLRVVLTTPAPHPPLLLPAPCTSYLCPVGGNPGYGHGTNRGSNQGPSTGCETLLCPIERNWIL